MSGTPFRIALLDADQGSAMIYSGPGYTSSQVATLTNYFHGTESSGRKVLETKSRRLTYA